MLYLFPEPLIPVNSNKDFMPERTCVVPVVLLSLTLKASRYSGGFLDHARQDAKAFLGLGQALPVV